MSLPKSLASSVSQLAASMAKGLLEPALFRFTTADGPPAQWHVRRFELREALFEPYALTIEVLTADTDVEIEPLLGARCTLGITRGEHGRVVHGIVQGVQGLGRVAERVRVRLDVVPALALLEQRSDTRFWQEKTVPEILRAVLTTPLSELGATIELRLDESAYAPREYCVQHRETDLDFAARLMAEEGLTYFFVHDPDEAGEILVILDSTLRAPELVHALPLVPFVPKGTGTVHTQSLHEFDWHSRLRTTAFAQRDWDWEATDRSPYMHLEGGADARGRRRERYEHDDRRLHADDGDVRARHKLERKAVARDLGHGRGDVVEMLPGHIASLYNLPSGEPAGDFLLLRVLHRGDAPEEDLHGADHDKQGDRYVNQFECMDAAIPYRPQQLPARPRIHGPHTAIVVGPPSEEIYTDEHGRIRVRFHWDRVSPADETASCWIRVAQTWAGPGWGTVFLPRIGMEVLVEFLDGDPERPLVVGCVYNSFHRPPYPLPEDKTKSTIKSDSSPGGGGSNELRFEDAKGAEEVYIHAQKDMNELVEHDNTRTVRNDQSFAITANQSFTVGGNQSFTVTGNRSLTVTQGNQSTTVSTGKSTTTIQQDRDITVVAGNSSKTVVAGTHTEIIKKQIKVESQTEGIDLLAKQVVSVMSSTNDLTMSGKKNASLVAVDEKLLLQGKTDVSLASTTTKVSIGAPNQIALTTPQAVDVNGKVITIHATEKIVLSVGASSITIEPAGITISAPKISSAAVGVHEVSGALIKIN